MRKNKPEETQKLPQKLKQLRAQKGWSQGQLAKRMDINVKQISKYERGTSFPTVDVIVKLAKAYSISIDALIFDDRKIDMNNITNHDLLKRFDQISQLEEKSQEALITIMDALIMQHQILTMAKTKP